MEATSYVVPTVKPQRGYTFDVLLNFVSVPFVLRKMHPASYSNGTGFFPVYEAPGARSQPVTLISCQG